MHADWKSFLQTSGAEFENDTLASFGNPEQEGQILWSGNTFCDLSPLGLIAVGGADAASFLQNQLTNDVKLVSDTSCQLTAVCTPKGRMIAILRLFKQGDLFYLSVAAELVTPLITHLRKYVIIAKVTLQDVSDAFVHLGCSGVHMEAEVSGIAGIAAPTEPNQVATLGENMGNGFLAKIPGTIPRYEWIVPAKVGKFLWQKLDVRCAPVGSHQWRLLDIHAGLPSVHTQTVEAFVPQMANLHLVNAVSFTKGCYPGQEIVARTQYLGKLKRRMYLGHVEQGHTPKPGDDLYASIADASQASGKVVDGQPSSTGGFDLLLVTQIANVESGEIRLQDANGPIIQINPLPYAFEPEES